VISTISAITWFLAEFAGGLVYSHPAIYIWNTLIRLGFFIVSSILLSELKSALNVNQELARVDFVTKAVSARYFYERVQIEINRFRRTGHPLTLVYLDLDNFKSINDCLGHNVGDRVLFLVSNSIQQHIRVVDILGRLGGDEFIVLLPETGEQESQQAVERIRSNLQKVMADNAWQVTFSIGVVTFLQMPERVDEMIKYVDDRMYSVKTNGKNGVNYQIYSK
jgi:diguanylate cyclase (GGDEF)-like protein